MIERARGGRFFDQKSPILFIDEIHRFSKSQQDSLLGAVEKGTVTLIGATTENPSFEVIRPLLSRCAVYVLKSLSKDDFKRILTEPKNSLTRQYTALLGTEGVTLEFTDDAIDKMAAIAEEVNSRSENIGARRLHTIMEKVTEEISFDADEHSGETIKVDSSFVEEKLKNISTDQDLSRYIL